MAEFLKIAHLEDEDVAEVRDLEKKLGTHVMAFEPGLSIATLSDAQLQQIQDLEDKLGVILLVYED